MRSKKKKRFLIAQQIKDEIDQYKVKYQKEMDASAAQDRKADMLFQKGGNWVEAANVARHLAGRHRATAGRIIENRLPYLKRKLAEFQTPQLPAIDNGDRSIPA